MSTAQQQDQEAIIHTYHGQVHFSWNSLNKRYSGKSPFPKQESTVPTARRLNISPTVFVVLYYENTRLQARY